MRDFIENKALYNSIYDPTHNTYTLEKTKKLAAKINKQTFYKLKAAKLVYT